MPTQSFSVEVIARLLDLTPRRVQQLSLRGVIPKARHGAYDLLSAVRGYVRYLRDDYRDSAEPSDSVNDRARLLKARADLADLEAKRMSEELIPTDQIEPAWAEIKTAIGDRLQAIPVRVARAVFDAKSAVEIQAILRTEICEALGDLAGVSVEVETPRRDLHRDGTGGIQLTTPTDAKPGA